METWITLPPRRGPASWLSLGYGDLVVPLRLNFYGHPKAGLHWEQHCAKNILANGFNRVRGWDNGYQHKTLQLWLSVYVDDKLAGAKSNIGPMWKSRMKTIDLEPPVSLHDNVYLGCKQEPETIDMDPVLQKSTTSNGFFMNKHVQDVADAVESNRLRLAGAVRDSCLLLARPGEGYNRLRSHKAEHSTSTALGIGEVSSETCTHVQGNDDLGGPVASPAMLDPILCPMQMRRRSLLSHAWVQWATSRARVLAAK